MQLEKYVRNLLVDEDTQEISNPIPTEFERDMSPRENNLSSSEGEGNSLEFQNSRHETKPSLSVNTKIHRHRQRRSQNRLLRRNVKKNGKISSIPFQQYNSLRIMVPSVASNENASRVSQNWIYWKFRMKYLKVVLKILRSSNSITFQLIDRSSRWGRSIYQGAWIHVGKQSDEWRRFSFAGHYILR